MANKKKVLVVDDSAIMRLTVSNVLSEDPNLQVIDYASNGKEALAKLDSIKPDLIMLDIEMPEMDGVEFLRNVRLKSQAKILVLTAEPSTSPKVAFAKTLGVDGVIHKPSGVGSQDFKQQKGLELKQHIYRTLNLS